MIGGIDYEIDRRRREQERPGWTVWALWSSLAVVVWLATEEYKSGLPPSDMVFWTLAIRLICSAVESCAAVVNSVGYQPGIKGRFDPAFYRIPNTFLRAIALSLELGLIGALQFVGSSPVPLGGKVSVVVILALTALLLWFTAFQIRDGLFIPRKRSFWESLAEHQIARAVILIVTMSILLVPALIYGVAAVQSGPPTASALRWALLANAAVWLLVRAAPSGRRDPAIGQLVEIRARLSFGQMTAQEATKEAERIALGWNADAVLEAQQQSFFAQCKSIEDICKTVEQRLARAEEARAQFPDMARDVLTLAHADMKEALTPYKALLDASTTLAVRIELLRKNGGDMGELGLIKSKVDFSVKYAEQRLQALAVRHSALTSYNASASAARG